MKKLKISDKGYEILLKFVQDALINSKSNSQYEKDLEELLRDLKTLK
jgi:hypothetical protein